jgi:hypothetical protein
MTKSDSSSVDYAKLKLLNNLDPEMILKPGFNNKINISFARGEIEDKRPFGITGPIKYKNSYYKHDRLDPFDRIIALTKTGQQIFKQIRDERDKDLNIATMTQWNELNVTQTRFKQRGVSDLIKSKIICKAKEFKKYSFKPNSHTYMINPYFIKCNKYNMAKEFWKEFTGETELK